MKINIGDSFLIKETTPPLFGGEAGKGTEREKIYDISIVAMTTDGGWIKICTKPDSFIRNEDDSKWITMKEFDEFEFLGRIEFKDENTIRKPYE